MAKLSIAVVGGTTAFGQSIVSTLLSKPLRPFVSRLVLLTREPDSGPARDLEVKGAQLIRVDNIENNSRATQEGLEKVLELHEINTVVNLITSSLSPFNEPFVRAVVGPRSKVKVYFPSEFGVDYRGSENGNREWEARAKHVREARELSAGHKKVIALYTGLAINESILSFFTFDSTSRTITPNGPPNARVTLTSASDVARTLAQLGSLVCNPHPAHSVPDDVRISGSSSTLSEIASALTRSGGKVVSSLFGASNEPDQHMLDLLREGKLDLSNGNHNELVNPRQSGWRWESVEEQARSANYG